MRNNKNASSCWTCVFPYCIGTPLCPLNVFQNYSSVFHQISIMLIWDQLWSHSMKAFSVFLTWKMWWFWLFIIIKIFIYLQVLHLCILWWWFIRFHSKMNVKCFLTFKSSFKSKSENDKNVSIFLVLRKNKNGLKQNKQTNK